jgi:hypothetical protein
MVGGTNGETITLNIRNVADRRIFRISLRLGSWDTWSEAIAHGGGIEFFNQALRDTFQRVIDERIEQATYPISLQRKIGNSIFELVLATLDVRFSPFDPSDRQ